MSLFRIRRCHRGNRRVSEDIGDAVTSGADAIALRGYLEAIAVIFMHFIYAVI